MEYNFRNRTFEVKRIPAAEDKSLKPWSAADEHILKYLEDENVAIAEGSVTVFHDRFGFLACAMSPFNPSVFVHQYSQSYAIRRNMKRNNFKAEYQINFPLDLLTNMDLALVRIPKSLELFKLYLHKIAEFSFKEVTVVCAFMTRHFTPQYVKIAEEYFEDVQQSRAYKKSRLLILKNKKEVLPSLELINNIPFKGKDIQQYLGVFSSGKIDHATQFLIDNINLRDEDEVVLDLASGNGILGATIREKKPDAKINFLDDSYLAVYSSMKNVSDENSYHICKNDLNDYEGDQFDFVISNPPFHFEHEIDISVPVGLFEEVARCLKQEGHFQLVANKHLNYKTHLNRLFYNVDVIAKNDKFEVFDCSRKK